MWFLTVLFILSVIGAVIEKRCSKYRYLLWIIVFVTLNILPAFWLRNELIYLLPFFVLAYSFSNLDWSRINHSIGIISVILFCLMLHFYSFDDSLYQMDDQVMTGAYHFKAIFRFCIGAVGSLASIWICRFLQEIPHLRNVLIYLGGITLPIYVLHQKFMMWNYSIMYTNSSMLFDLCVTILIILLSLAFYKIMVKSTLLKRYFFGEYNKS